MQYLSFTIIIVTKFTCTSGPAWCAVTAEVAQQILARGSILARRAATRLSVCQHLRKGYIYIS